jgi:hypothetical protein
MLSAVLTKLEHSWRLSDWLPEALTIGLGLAPADPDYADRLRTAQIAAIVRLTPLTMGASCLNASILLVTLGCMGPVSPGLGIWASLVFATAIYYAQNWLLLPSLGEIPSPASRWTRLHCCRGSTNC